MDSQWGDDGSSSFGHARARALVSRVARNVVNQLDTMRGVLGGIANPADFENLEESALAILQKIELLIADGRIEPLARLRHSARGGFFPPWDKELRIGVFPLAANPFHWAHLLGGLLVVERFQLDKLVFLVAGTDPRKPTMAPESVRHSMAKEIIDLFHPLFEYSSLALGTAIAGEEQLFRILRMNPAQPVHAFYIAGGDHFHRFNPGTGSADTIQRLEDGMAGNGSGFDGHFHRVSAVFLARGGEEENIETVLDVHHLEGLPLVTSSTEVRRALAGRGRRRVLYTLPYVAFLSICQNRLYGA